MCSFHGEMRERTFASSIVILLLSQKKHLTFFHKQTFQHMKKLLILAVFTAFLYSCGKDPMPPSISNEAMEVTQDTVQVAFTPPASDREGTLYVLAFDNCTLGSYHFKGKITDQFGQLMWSDAGWYSGDIGYTMNLRPGKTHYATLVFDVAHPGQKGTINYYFRKANVPLCYSGTLGIPGGQSFMWTACQ